MGIIYGGVQTCNHIHFLHRANLTEKDQLEQEEGPYSPFDNRDPNGASAGGALAHLLKSSLGTGILAMPMAFHNAGLVFGSVMTLIVGFLCTHCVHILVSNSGHLTPTVPIDPSESGICGGLGDYLRLEIESKQLAQAVDKAIQCLNVFSNVSGCITPRLFTSIFECFPEIPCTLDTIKPTSYKYSTIRE